MSKRGRVTFTRHALSLDLYISVSLSTHSAAAFHSRVCAACAGLAGFKDEGAQGQKGEVTVYRMSERRPAKGEINYRQNIVKWHRRVLLPSQLSRHILSYPGSIYLTASAGVKSKVICLPRCVHNLLMKCVCEYSLVGRELTKLNSFSGFSRTGDKSL